MSEVVDDVVALPADSEGLLQVLRDKVEIERLVRRYADLCDEGYEPEALGALFTTDGVWAASSEAGTSDFGVYEGRDAIKAFFASVSAEIVFAHHIVMSPEIDVIMPGSSARGRWNTMVWMRLREDPLGVAGDCKLMAAVYRHEYRHTEEGWRIAHLHVHTRFDARLRLVG